MRIARVFVLFALLVVAACGTPEAGQAPPPASTVAPVVEATSAPPVATDTTATELAPTPEAAATAEGAVTATAVLTEVPGTYTPGDALLTVGAPQGGEVLLRDVWPVRTDVAPTRYLYYLENPSPDESAITTEAVFWRVDLQTGAQTRIAARPASSPLDLLGQAQLSPDGQWIAYQRDMGENSADLFLVRSDGSDERLVAQGVGTVAEGCEAYFAWSPDSTRLAFNRYDDTAPDPGWRLEVVALAQLGSVTQVTTAPFMKFVGWTTVDRLLFLNARPPDNMIQVDEADLLSQTSRTVITFPKGVGGGCSTLAPSGTSVVLAMTDGNWLVDIPGNALQSFNTVSSSNMHWTVDSTGIISLPSNDLEQVTLLASVPVPTIHKIRITPAGAPDSSNQWGSFDVAPEGYYIAACQFSQFNDGTQRLRSLVYSIQDNQWMEITAGCVTFVGWSQAL